MMTDKATGERQSPAAGTVIALARTPGDQIAIGNTLATIETDAEADTLDTWLAAQPLALRSQPRQYGALFDLDGIAEN